MKEFTGSKWDEYSEFEFFWIETVLTRGVFSRVDLLILCDKFGVRFFSKDWQNTLKLEDIGGVLISDIPKEELLPAVEDIYKNKYPKKIDFKEAEDIYQKLQALANEYVNDTKLAKAKLFEIYKKISPNISELRTKFIERDILSNKEDNVAFIIKFILEDIMKKDRKEVKQLVERFENL